jgi:hypothetical protein
MANKATKTEHSGAKHGKGAFYGRKADAKQNSNKARRANDKVETTVLQDDINRLSKKLNVFCVENNLPQTCASDLRYGDYDLTVGQESWLEDFIEDWETTLG